MTREERAREVLNGLPDRAFHTTDELVTAMLSFADAEAAAMRERAAKCAEQDVPEAADGGTAAHEALCGLRIATAIRALPTTEVGNG